MFIASEAPSFALCYNSTSESSLQAMFTSVCVWYIDGNVDMTSLPYFGVKLSCVYLMFAYRKKLPIVTLR